MKIVEISNTITEIEGVVRIEPSHLRKNEVATEALLSNDVTATHYQVGKPDSVGRTIKLGEPMDYIDSKNRGRVFCVYERLDLKVGDTDPVTGKKAAVAFTRWMRKDHRPTFVEALSYATDIAEALRA